jgi:hypothetical protein
MLSGLYEIVQLESGRAYIGSSDNVPRRLRAHRSMLNAGTHDNIRLQRAWNRDGPEAFEFREIERCPIDCIREREHSVIQTRKPLVYNTSPVVRPGARASNSALTDRQVIRLRKRAAVGESVPDLARAFGVHFVTAQRIVAGKTYTRITGGKPARGPLKAVGGRIASGRLTEQQARDILGRLADGEQPAALARAFGVSPGAVYHLRDGLTWRHLHSTS